MTFYEKYKKLFFFGGEDEQWWGLKSGYEIEIGKSEDPNALFTNYQSTTYLRNDIEYQIQDNIVYILNGDYYYSKNILNNTDIFKPINKEKLPRLPFRAFAVLESKIFFQYDNSTDDKQFFGYVDTKTGNIRILGEAKRQSYVYSIYTFKTQVIFSGRTQIFTYSDQDGFKELFNCQSDCYPNGYFEFNNVLFFEMYGSRLYQYDGKNITRLDFYLSRGTSILKDNRLYYWNIEYRNAIPSVFKLHYLDSQFQSHTVGEFKDINSCKHFFLGQDNFIYFSLSQSNEKDFSNSFYRSDGKTIKFINTAVLPNIPKNETMVGHYACATKHSKVYFIAKKYEKRAFGQFTDDFLMELDAETNNFKVVERVCKDANDRERCFGSEKVECNGPFIYFSSMSFNDRFSSDLFLIEQ